VVNVVRVAIVDPQPLFRTGLEFILSREPDFTVVGTGSTSADAIALVETSDPDLVFLDMAIPGGGIEAAAGIKRTAKRPVRVMFLTTANRREDISAALEAGASGYMLKGIAPDVLLQTLRMVGAGETYIMPQLASQLLMSGLRRTKFTDAQVALDLLTQREHQILKEVSSGRTNKEIARSLDLSEKTIKHYMGRVLQKLSVRNRTEAVVLAHSVMSEPGYSAQA
jgi:two-component system nitrate/nitrite response regulator NarL